MDPRLLIIDGVLDGIDENTVGGLLANITGPTAPWSLLVLSHESDIVRRFSKGYRLEHGTLIAIDGGSGL
jgi:ABC-type molybdenum transport system ATPase subunit/photorepair protein PhrA